VRQSISSARGGKRARHFQCVRRRPVNPESGPPGKIPAAAFEKTFLPLCVFISTFLAKLCVKKLSLLGASCTFIFRRRFLCVHLARTLKAAYRPVGVA